MNSGKITAPPMVWLKGDEMTRYVMQLVHEKWVDPYIDTTAWEYYDLGVKHRDETKDEVLYDAVKAGKRICAIFKDATITPTAEQAKEFGLSQTYGSPNKVIRQEWNGISISRDTVAIAGVPVGYKNPVLFDRYPQGGLYNSSFYYANKPGRVTTTFTDEDGESQIVDERNVVGNKNVIVTFTTPVDPLKDFARNFFKRALESKVVPYLVTKKTAFKYQEAYWNEFKTVYDMEFADKFAKAGLAEFSHILTDAATIYLNNWRDGGFAFAAPNYEGDTLTDQLGAVHGSPALVTSILTGISSETGQEIKEFEAVHGTGHTDWMDHQAGKDTSFNPLGLTNALWGAMDHSATLCGGKQGEAIKRYTEASRNAVEKTMQDGCITKDIANLYKDNRASVTTEIFIDTVAKNLAEIMG